MFIYLGDMDYNGHNIARMAETWMDMYKDNLYLARGDLVVSYFLFARASASRPPMTFMQRGFQSVGLM